jgi:hypothetical protein
MSPWTLLRSKGAVLGEDNCEDMMDEYRLLERDVVIVLSKLLGSRELITYIVDVSASERCG